MMQTRENGQKLHFDPSLTPLDPQNGGPHFFSGKLVTLVATHHAHLSLYAKLAKRNDANSRKWTKASF